VYIFLVTYNKENQFTMYKTRKEQQSWKVKNTEPVGLYEKQFNSTRTKQCKHMQSRSKISQFQEDSDNIYIIMNVYCRRWLNFISPSQVRRAQYLQNDMNSTVSSNTTNNSNLSYSCLSRKFTGPTTAEHTHVICTL
jgi:hypothetical protein